MVRSRIEPAARWRGASESYVMAQHKARRATRWTLDQADRLRDPARLAAVRDRAAPDRPTQQAFDRLAQLSKRALGARMVLVTLVEVDRQLLAGSYGLPEPWASRREVPLSYRFSQHVVT